MTRSFFVPGRAVPSPRPHIVGMGRRCRVCKRAAQSRVILGTGDMPRRYAGWKERVRMYARQAGVEPIKGPVSVSLAFQLPVPPTVPVLLKDGTPSKSKNARPYPTGQRSGDCDNHAKSVLDALNGVLYEDDSAIVSLHVQKRWALPPLEPGVSVIYSPFCQAPPGAVLDAGGPG